MRVWLEKVDDVVDPPADLPTQGKVRRRRWRSQAGPRRWFELTFYLGPEVETGIALCYWEAEVWDCGQPMERMTSGVRTYQRVLHPGVAAEGMSRLVTPTEVATYAVWGELMLRDGRERC